MIKLLFGTGNHAKLNVMKDHLKGMEIELIGLKDLAYPWPKVEENGRDPLENARIKALAYFDCCHMPVFSCDSGLYIEGLEPSRQPGVHVRNIDGRTLSDEEMVAHYAAIAQRMGGSCKARYQNAICLVINENEIYEYSQEDISGETFLIVDVPHNRAEEGFPIDRLSVHIASGLYYNDMENYDICSSMGAGMRDFFRRSLKHSCITSDKAMKIMI
jgi:XTP/dITP diphosphohydrolase